MAEKKKIKLNIFDTLVILVIIVLMGTFAVSFKTKKPFSRKPMLVTVRVPNTTDISYPEGPDSYGLTYFNTVNIPVKVIKTDKKYEAGTLKWTDIILLGEGDISNDRDIFEGARILVGQKAEIHSNYFAQGIITEIKYADK